MGTAPVSGLGGLMLQSGSGRGDRLGAHCAYQVAGPVPADLQPEAEGVPADGPAGFRAVLGVQLPGAGQQALGTNMMAGLLLHT